MSRRILVVDDDDDIREVAAATLELIGGFAVSTAASGSAAIDAARQARPDAILLDVMMPDLDGPATMAGLRADPATSTVPVVFLTAKVLPAERNRLLALGAADVIAKPFDPATLPGQLLDALGWS